jgi:PIN domain nuclease of toxin-antitoxin system
MRGLLDTHAFLWFVLNDPNLSSLTKGFIADPANELHVSPASYWEVAIKVSIGKYSLTSSFEAFWRKGIGDNGFRILPIEISHAAAVAALPFHHRDPFDRLIAAQATVERMPIVSNDPALDAYGVHRVW